MKKTKANKFYWPENYKPNKNSKPVTYNGTEYLSKVYIVSEYGDEYEDRWEQVIGVCSSYKLAEELKNKYLASKEVKTNISEEEYGKMLDYLCDYEAEHGAICESEAEGVKKLFPNYNPKDKQLKLKEKNI